MSIIDILSFIKEYWFIITLLLSLVTTVFYFIFFDVNPLDKQYEIKIRKKHARLHNAIGLDLLRLGHHSKAKEQFKKVLEYRPHNRKALKGYFLSDLFLEHESLGMNPSIIVAMLKRIRDMGIAYDDDYDFIYLKLIADLESATGNTKGAINGYNNAITKAEHDNLFYTAAYDILGWGIYSNSDNLTSQELGEMEKIFREISENEKNDYRGFHGLGYTYFVRAIREKDIDKRQKLIDLAAEQCQTAVYLLHNRAHVAMDL